MVGSVDWKGSEGATAVGGDNGKQGQHGRWGGEMLKPLAANHTCWGRGDKRLLAVRKRGC